MNRWTIAAFGVIALAGCETLNSPQAVANADAQRDECKATVVTSTTDSMRMQNQRGVDGDPMRRTEATLALGRLKLDNPRALRNDIAPEDNITSKALRAC